MLKHVVKILASMEMNNTVLFGFNQSKEIICTISFNLYVLLILKNVSMLNVFLNTTVCFMRCFTETFDLYVSAKDFCNLGSPKKNLADLILMNSRKNAISFVKVSNKAYYVNLQDLGSNCFPCNALSTVKL